MAAVPQATGTFYAAYLAGADVRIAVKRDLSSKTAEDLCDLNDTDPDCITRYRSVSCAQFPQTRRSAQ